MEWPSTKGRDKCISSKNLIKSLASAMQVCSATCGDAPWFLKSKVYVLVLSLLAIALDREFQLRFDPKSLDQKKDTIKKQQQQQ